MSKLIKAELFDVEATQHRTVNHGAAQRGLTLILTTRQVAHEDTRKAVACSGRIVRLFEGKRRDAEDPAFVDHHGAVLSELHNQSRRSGLDKVRGGAQHIMFTATLGGMGLSDR